MIFGVKLYKMLHSEHWQATIFCLPNTGLLQILQWALWTGLKLSLLIVPMIKSAADGLTMAAMKNMKGSIVFVLYPI